MLQERQYYKYDNKIIRRKEMQSNSNKIKLKKRKERISWWLF